ncbi:hypothetical protein Syn7502_02387 [Synechococcus sp. PCC 7502]|uniref:Spy/CpxP family protein refolding chaperone n=1 Tax=Synechococcus sp. PCC 7502 TaxID=1173263 RepID=UPI00029F93D9|nr:Spy/CpxP family protein refolding chaperone [Synechococcus sp. PCC 7502]AFY74372.1 hypothetical protein Syn7502_02387 [Synechococcus sp. PCC 7502]
MKLSSSFIAVNTLALIFLTPAIAFSQPSDRPPEQNRPEFKQLDWQRLDRELNLTETQKQQMKALRDNTRTQINAVLTTEQKSQLEAAIKSGTNPRQAMRSLNLSDAQKTRIKAIKESEKAKRDALLTSEQKQKLEKLRASRPQLNLTAEQKQKMQAIRTNTREKIAEVLTPEQKIQFEQNKKPSDRRELMNSLQEDQKSKIRAIRAEAKQEIASILTPAQLQELKEKGGQKWGIKNK